METVNEILSGNIVAFRKEKGMTQNDFAEQLGVTYQAVSKWENGKSAPDIGFLPQIADIFNCTLDELFSRSQTTPAVATDPPFEDDGIIRGVVYRGKTMLTVTDPLQEKFTFEVQGEIRDVQSRCNVTVTGSVLGKCKAGHSVTVNGNIDGGCEAGHSVSVANNLTGGCQTGHSLSIGNNLYGGCTAGFAVACGNNIEGDVAAGNRLTVKGDVTAATVKCEKGSLSCASLVCDSVNGKVILCKGWKKKTLQEE